MVTMENKWVKKHRESAIRPNYTACVPNHQRWYANWKFSWNMYVCTHCTLHVFAHLVPICMLSRCLLNKISASELSRKFIKGALLVGHVLRGCLIRRLFLPSRSSCRTHDPFMHGANMLCLFLRAGRKRHRVFHHHFNLQKNCTPGQRAHGPSYSCLATLFLYLAFVAHLTWQFRFDVAYKSSGRS